MKVGLVIYGSLSILSGGYLYDRLLVEHLRAQGDEVEVIGLPWRGYRRSLADNLSRALLDQLAQTDVDILLQDELNHSSLFWLNRQLRRRVRYPIISIVHHLRSSEENPLGRSLLYRWVEARYLASLDGCIYNSRTTQEVVERLVGRRPSVIAYPGGDRLAPAIDAAQVERRARQPGPLRVLFIGNVIPRKGLHTLIDALARLERGTWQLAVVGNLTFQPEYVRLIHQQIGRLGLAEHVWLMGKLSDAALGNWLTSSHVLAVPSSYEGFGIVYMEAMGHGLPVIASTAGAAAEIIAPGQNGFLIAPGDVAALAGHLRSLQADRSLLARLGLAARERFAAHPTWVQSMAGIRRFLLEMIT